MRAVLNYRIPAFDRFCYTSVPTIQRSPRVICHPRLARVGARRRPVSITTRFRKEDARGLYEVHAQVSYNRLITASLDGEYTLSDLILTEETCLLSLGVGTSKHLLFVSVRSTHSKPLTPLNKLMTHSG